MISLKELLTELDFEQWLDTEGIIYRRGGISARGREINIKECPVCGSSNWKVYFNLTHSVGKCFAGDHPEEIQFNKLVFLKYYSGKSRRDFEEYVQNALISQGWAPKKEEVVLASAVELEGPVALPRHYELPVEGRLPDYLVKRQISAEMARYFDLRYCVEGKHAYVDPYTDQVKGQVFDMRILLPVYDLDGVMKTFQGRDVTGTAERRYLFPMQLPAPELPGVGQKRAAMVAFTRRNPECMKDVRVGAWYNGRIIFTNSIMCRPDEELENPINLTIKSVARRADVEDDAACAAFVSIMEQDDLEVRTTDLITPPGILDLVASGETNKAIARIREMEYGTICDMCRSDLELVRIVVDAGQACDGVMANFSSMISRLANNLSMIKQEAKSYAVHHANELLAPYRFQSMSSSAPAAGGS